MNELEEISKLSSYYNNNIDEIIRNIYNRLITNINGRDYILIKKNNNQVTIDKLLLKKNYVNKSLFVYINRNNWVELWSKKIDYIEYQLNHIENKYPIARDSIQYYIGLAENAISYIRDTFNLKSNNELVVSHVRIMDKDINMPQNIIIDYYSRDISEYLKYLFYYKKYDYVKITDFLKKAELNEFSYRLIYGRMFFVTFYFDIFDNIINNEVGENELKKILNRTIEYEDYIKNIYSIITEFVLIPEISWI